MVTQQQNPKAFVPAPRIPVGNLFEQYQQQAANAARWKSQANIRDLFYRKLADGEHRRVRFLADFNDAMTILVHNRYYEKTPDGKNDPRNLMEVVCHEMYGLPCPHCGDVDVITEERWCWPVYLFPTEAEQEDGAKHGRFAITFMPRSEQKVIGQVFRIFAALMKEAEESGEAASLMDYDFQFERTGSKKENTKYAVTHVPRRKNVHTDHIRVPSQAKILEIATAAWNADLYETIQQYPGLVDGDDYWTNPQAGVQASIVSAAPQIAASAKPALQAVPQPRVNNGLQAPGSSRPKAAAPVVKPQQPMDYDGDDDDSFSREDMKRVLAQTDEDEE